MGSTDPQLVDCPQCGAPESTPTFMRARGLPCSACLKERTKDEKERVARTSDGDYVEAPKEKP